MKHDVSEKAGFLTYSAAAIVIISFSVFLILMYGINAGKTFSFEHPVQTYFQSWNEGYVHLFFKGWTELGSRIGIGVALIAVCIWLGWKKRDFVAIGIAALLVTGADRLNVFIKYLVARDRPRIDASIDAVGYSFPSGHAMLIIVTYGIIAYFLSRSLSLAGKAAIWLAAAAIILSVGISRIVLSAHYPTDVLAGYCLGLVMLLLAMKAYKAVKRRVDTRNIR